MINRLKKTPGHFITIERDPIDKDVRLSSSAVGVLVYLMGRPENWNPTIDEIASHFSDSVYRIKKACKELQNAGYILLKARRDEKSGKMIGWDWHVSDRYGEFTDKSPKVDNEISESKNTQPKVEIRTSVKGTEKPLQSRHSQGNHRKSNIDFQYKKEKKRNLLLFDRSEVGASQMPHTSLQECSVTGLQAEKPSIQASKPNKPNNNGKNSKRSLKNVIPEFQDVLQTVSRYNLQRNREKLQAQKCKLLQEVAS